LDGIALNWTVAAAPIISCSALKARALQQHVLKADMNEPAGAADATRELDGSVYG